VSLAEIHRTLFRVVGFGTLYCALDLSSIERCQCVTHDAAGPLHGQDVYRSQRCFNNGSPTVGD